MELLISMNRPSRANVSLFFLQIGAPYKDLCIVYSLVHALFETISHTIFFVLFGQSKLDDSILILNSINCEGTWNKCRLPTVSDPATIYLRGVKLISIAGHIKFLVVVGLSRA